MKKKIIKYVLIAQKKGPNALNTTQKKHRFLQGTVSEKNTKKTHQNLQFFGHFG